MKGFRAQRRREQVARRAQPSHIDYRVPGKHRADTEARTGDVPCTGEHCAEHTEVW